MVFQRYRLQRSRWLSKPRGQKTSWPKKAATLPARVRNIGNARIFARLPAFYRNVFTAGNSFFEENNTWNKSRLFTGHDPARTKTRGSGREVFEPSHGSDMVFA